MTIRERVAVALLDVFDRDGTPNESTDAAITAFLEAAAEEGWHMRPDEATADMCRAVEGHFARPSQWRAMLAAAPEFEGNK